jgi:hypothetical protein
MQMAQPGQFESRKRHAPAVANKIYDHHALRGNTVMTTPPQDLRIVEAANLGTLNAVTSLIEEGVDVSVNDDWALRCAARVGNLEVVKKLVEAGANPRAMDSMAAKWATLEGHTEIMRWLVQHGAHLKLAWLAEATKESAWKESVVDLLLNWVGPWIEPTEVSAICLQALKTGHKGMYLLLWHHGIRAHPTEIAERIAKDFFNLSLNSSDLLGVVTLNLSASDAHRFLKFHSEDEQIQILDTLAKLAHEKSELLGNKMRSSDIAAGAWATSLIHNLPVDWSAAMKRLGEEYEEYQDIPRFVDVDWD